MCLHYNERMWVTQWANANEQQQLHERILIAHTNKYNKLSRYNIANRIDGIEAGATWIVVYT